MKHRGVEQLRAGGRGISKAEYIHKGIAPDSEIESLLTLHDDYPLTQRQLDEYEQNGFIVLKNFLNSTVASALGKVIGHNLDELAFPDMLSGCSRKFHGESLPQQCHLLPVFLSDTGTFLPSPKPTMPATLVAPKSGCQRSTLTRPLEQEAPPLFQEATSGPMGADRGASKHPCFVHNLFEPLAERCQDLLETTKVTPTLNPGDIIVFSRFPLHRSYSRDPRVPFESGRRLGYTLRLGAGKLDLQEGYPELLSVSPYFQL